MQSFKEPYDPNLHARWAEARAPGAGQNHSRTHVATEGKGVGRAGRCTALQRHTALSGGGFRLPPGRSPADAGEALPATNDSCPLPTTPLDKRHGA